MSKTPMKSFEIIKEMYERFVKHYRDLEPKLMICEKEDFATIETALKNYQELIERPCVLVGRTSGHTKALIDVISKNYKEIKITNLEDEKKLKALEIIEPYCIVAKYPDDTYELAFCRKICIEKEEYDLLKEVLL